MTNSIYWLVATLSLFVDGGMDGHIFTNSMSHLCWWAEMTRKWNRAFCTLQGVAKQIWRMDWCRADIIHLNHRGEKHRVVPERIGKSDNVNHWYCFIVDSWVDSKKVVGITMKYGHNHLIDRLVFYIKLVWIVRPVTFSWSDARKRAEDDLGNSLFRDYGKPSR